MNALNELLNTIDNLYTSIHCARIFLDSATQSKKITLKVGHYEGELTKFKKELDFEYFYDEELIGTVWLTDGSWLERTKEEFDGEWYTCWRRFSSPEIPDELFY